LLRIAVLRSRTWLGLDGSAAHDRLRGLRATLTMLLITFVTSAAGSSCQIVGKYETFERGEDAGAPHPCDVLPGSKVDEKGIATMVLSKPPGGKCYWIDRTEVTVAQYGQFLSSSDKPAWDAKRCSSWKDKPSDPVSETTEECTDSTNRLEAGSDPFRSTKPIRCIDWCDAKAFCIWAGKDLCGGTTNAPGGLVEPGDLPDEWGHACAPGGDNYLHGIMAVRGECNVGLGEVAGQCRAIIHQDFCAPTYPGDFPTCTATSGAVDMIGNVAEWVISCTRTSEAGPDKLCQHRGGSFADVLSAGTCYLPASSPLSSRKQGIGVRCCAPLTMAEDNLVK
jgi:sulfatase modifying factor 1